MEDPKWIQEARKYIGLKEVPGSKHNPIIVKMAERMSGGVIHDDETAWCGTFVGYILDECGLPIPKNPLSSRAFLELPNKILKPAVGAIAVFWRGSQVGWQGHAGFVVGKTANGNLAVLGGNQNNQVSIVEKSTSQLLGYRWPSIAPLPERYILPIVKPQYTQATEA